MLGLCAATTSVREGGEGGEGRRGGRQGRQGRQGRGGEGEEGGEGGEYTYLPLSSRVQMHACRHSSALPVCKVLIVWGVGVGC